jgi:ribonuclease E
MATKRMLIDASHPEEIRVAVIDGNRLDEYDVEVASRRQLKGNIYLAKVTRVEPSLQAAFVDYGGNRHGFLAFGEIHPDYYQIPVADREQLLAEQAAIAQVDFAGEASEEAENGDQGGMGAIGSDDEEEVERRRPRPSPRNYKIQEVIKRRQIMLVQVAKEERGNKGAALTTYLSLAGRYCVLMPNTSRGGGISRKITSLTDRKRLKKILADLNISDGMAVIVRTAGAGCSKSEIKRDYEYLFRLWNNVREETLSAIAPHLIYEEGNLIKKSIRDLYGREIEEILVHGDPEYRTAKEFMKLFIPSHSKRVKLYEGEDRPLFAKYDLEDQIDAMHQPTVQLRSGGYIVINPTEAMVSIDVNSGRATRERHIEETALRTNIEAADEIARHLRLRDLAGLIVIDFIDMENPRNQAQVERRLKEAMKTDRARVQLGKISPFGLLELSRQRLRPSIMESSFAVCPACSGTGLRRTTESTVLAVLRKIEEEALKKRAQGMIVTMAHPIAMYLLNQKRRSLTEIEARHDVTVTIGVDDMLVPPDYRIERLRPVSLPREEGAVETAEDAPSEVPPEAPVSEAEESNKRGRRRRPRRRKRLDTDLTEGVTGEAEEAEPDAAAFDSESPETESDEDSEVAAAPVAAELLAEAPRKRRRRGKRGGRRRSVRPEGATEEAALAAPEKTPFVDLGEADAADRSLATATPADDALPPSPLETAVTDDVHELREESAGKEQQSDQETALETVVAAPPKRRPPSRRRAKTPAPSEALGLPDVSVVPAAAAAGSLTGDSSAAAAAADAPDELHPAVEGTPEPEQAASAETDSEQESLATAASADDMAAPQDASIPSEVVQANDASDAGDESAELPRRGWWQRLLS